MTDATPLASEQITRAQIIAFLNGAGPLEGLHFGDPHPSGRAFWWRKYLPALSASPAPSGQGVSGEVERKWFPHRDFAGNWMMPGNFREPYPMAEEIAAPSCAPGEVERLIDDAKEFADAATSDGFDPADALDLIREFAALFPQGLDAKDALGSAEGIPATPSQRLDAATVERCAGAAFAAVMKGGLGLQHAQRVSDRVRALATEPHQHGAGNGEKHGG